MIIEDEPAYNYRGITIDTSRNFIPIEVLFITFIISKIVPIFKVK
jgi:hypothetical protein